MTSKPYRWRLFAAILFVAATVFLFGCSLNINIPKPTKEKTRKPTQMQSTQSLPTMVTTTVPTIPTTSSNSRPGYWDNSLVQTTSTRPSTKPSTLSPLPPVPKPEDANSQLKFLQCGRFSGLYMEDGKDEYVQDIAALYVTNASDEYLEYANVKCVVNGQEAYFIVTGLKPGTSAWVLERNRLVIDEADVNDITMTHVSDQHSFKEDTQDKTADVIVNMESGYLTACNNTGKDLKSVYVYYKKQFSSGDAYQNGVFLGGITYRVLLGDIKNGETAQAIAGHCTPKGCEVVRVEWA